jgi:Flp pilus assembly CpaE family ATPase
VLSADADFDALMRASFGVSNLVSSNFEYVLFDMPRNWFSWTDSVLLSSNKLFVVSEITMPSLRLAKQLVAAIKTPHIHVGVHYDNR